VAGRHQYTPEAMKAITASYVFLDTDVFIESNFNYQSPRFKSVVQLAKTDRIQVFLTDLTLREIRANLEQAIDHAVSQRVQPILRNSDRPEVKQLFTRLDADEIKKELLGQLAVFLKEAKVTILPVDPASLAPVLDA
jgi:hypothetical protein